MARDTNARKPHGNGSGILWIVGIIAVGCFLFAHPEFLKGLQDAANAPRAVNEAPLAPIDPKYLPEPTAVHDGHNPPFSLDSADYVRKMSGEDLGGLRVLDVWDYKPEHTPVRITWDLSVIRDYVQASSLEDDTFSVTSDRNEDLEGHPGYNVIIHSVEGYDYPVTLTGDWVTVDGAQHIAIRQIFAVYGGFRFPR